MKRTFKGNTLLDTMYDMVPESAKFQILERKKSSMSENGKNVRIQCYLPKELYIILTFFGAFETSESDYFTIQAVDDVTRRGIRNGIINVNGQHVEGR